jgi:hypothetical protein
MTRTIPELRSTACGICIALRERLPGHRASTEQVVAGISSRCTSGDGRRRGGAGRVPPAPARWAGARQSRCAKIVTFWVPTVTGLSGDSQYAAQICGGAFRCRWDDRREAEFQREVWQRTAASEASTFFKAAALQVAHQRVIGASTAWPGGGSMGHRGGISKFSPAARGPREQSLFATFVKN